MKEDSSEVFEDGKNRSTKHVHQSLERRTAAGHHPNPGRERDRERILHSNTGLFKGTLKNLIICSVRKRETKLLNQVSLRNGGLSKYKGTSSL